MNMSLLISRIKIKCGLYTIATPFPDLDAVMTETIVNITRRTFSSYSPIKERVKFDLKSLEQLEKSGDQITVLLPDIFHNRELMQVIDLQYDDSNIMSLGYIGAGFPLQMGNMLNQSMIANANLHMTNQMIPKISFKYEHPRKVTIYKAFISSRLYFDLGFMHDESLASITPTQEESFYKLALYDVQDMLYQSMKHYAGIETAYGNIDLKLDEWAQAADKREQLVEEWRHSYHMDLLPFIYG